jgi:hypothetical protein
MTRVTMWLLLGLVASSAAVLSFSALKDLGDLCGFHRSLSWLLPLVVDAGAGCGCLIWLGTASPVRALRFARALTWVLLASSVGGNAVVHYLAAYSLRPAWWLVVAVSAIAPTVLGAVVHLSVLVGRTAEVDTAALDPIGQDNPPVEAAAAPTPPKPSSVPANTDSLISRTRELAPIGRRKLATELGVGEYQARTLLKQLTAEAPRNGHKILEDTGHAR